MSRENWHWYWDLAFPATGRGFLQRHPKVRAIDHHASIQKHGRREGPGIQAVLGHELQPGFGMCIDKSVGNRVAGKMSRSSWLRVDHCSPTTQVISNRGRFAFDQELSAS
jgi:hypothetical protein